MEKMISPSCVINVRNSTTTPSNNTMDIKFNRSRPRNILIRDRKESFGGERLREWPRERTKTVVAALLLFLSSLCTSFSLSFLNEVVPRDRPLPDVVFNLIPVQEWAWPMSDVLVLIMATICGLSMFLHRYRWIVMRRLFLIASILYVFRAMAMLVTWIPLSDRTMLTKCVTPLRFRNRDIDPTTTTIVDDSPQEKYSQSKLEIPWSMIAHRMWQYGISMGFVGLESNRVLCGDYIYSGHTLMYVLTTLTMRMYFPRRGLYLFLRYLYPMAALCGMICVVVSRLHYTVDVFIAYWMTTLTFSCYHLLVALPRSTSENNRNNNNNNNRFSDLERGGEFVESSDLDDVDEDTESNGSNRKGVYNLFGSRYVLEYFEKNVPAGVPVPREVDWPYSRPAWLCRWVNGMNETSTLSCDD